MANFAQTPVDPVFRNNQWAITTYGIECLDGSCPIDRARLSETRLGSDLYDLPLHMAEKSWVDLKAFLEAFRWALSYHRVGFDEAALRRTEAEAWEERRAA